MYWIIPIAYIASLTALLIAMQRTLTRLGEEVLSQRAQLEKLSTLPSERAYEENKQEIWAAITEIRTEMPNKVEPDGLMRSGVTLPMADWEREIALLKQQIAFGVQHKHHAKVYRHRTQCALNELYESIARIQQRLGMGIPALPPDENPFRTRG